MKYRNLLLTLKMKKLFLYLTLLITYGCSASKSSSSVVTSACPEKPTTTLNENDVQEIVLNEQTLTKSGLASANKSIGYKFTAKSGQKLSYSKNPDICVWIYTPDSQLLKSGDLPQTGKYIIQVSALNGSKTFDFKMSLGILQASSSSTPSVSTTSSPSTSASASTSGTNLTQEQALEIVREWYAAKPQIFAPPFDTSLVDKLATGKLHERTTKSDPETGRIAWLKANNSYYKYNQSEIKNVMDFSNSGKQPYIKIKVFEELYLYGRKGNIDRDNSGSYQSNFIYFFEQDNGVWKISDYSKVN